ncbi:putative YigZ family protein [Halospina denitrificans]|uniref:Putative YigZ family protein n=1 Tax=Halospina denitrificans TaxID=332522 RepID=A0A4R7K1M1_9GAMM|nr:YigZ family protein [Halospina denitrificans]TDT43389.1 putative YigZ family protein [Halospina denitrificans]
MNDAALYPVPASTGRAETEVRKSRFIAVAARAETREEALAVVEEARVAHPEARHHCWAYVLGEPGAATSAAMNDDGEPSGTAGRPILSVIEHKGIGDVVVVVSRYFGGVKLGAGGLVRAYAGAAEAVLSELPVTQREPVVTLSLSGGFADEQPLRHEADQLGGSVDEVRYGDGIEVIMTIPSAARETLVAMCQARQLEVVELG